MFDWKNCSNESEKYGLYLTSREWSLKKEMIKKRSKGICERCKHNKSQAVHHLTYKRKYKEQLDDLIDICNGCHDFIHAKTNIDPIHSSPVFLLGKEIKNVYLAGKMSGHMSWRDEIIQRWSGDKGFFKFSHELNESKYDSFEPYFGNDPFIWDIAQECLDLPDGRRLNFTGPYWLRDFKKYSTCGGHGGACPEPHVGCGVLENAMQAIKKSDLMFVWIDSYDCYGTLAEIGFAKAYKKIIVVAISKNLIIDDLWFPISMADTSFVATSAGEAWKNIWNINLQKLCSARVKLNESYRYDNSELSEEWNQRFEWEWQNEFLELEEVDFNKPDIDVPFFISCMTPIEIEKLTNLGFI
jgi:hypothetical protein